MESSKVKTAETQVKLLKGALQTYRLDVGQYPNTAQGLAALMAPPPEVADYWDGPYLEEELPMDPWRTPYVYQFPANNLQGFALYSLGRGLHRRRRGHQCRSGLFVGRVGGTPAFTLLELIVVLAILGAAVSLAMPNLQSFYATLTRHTDYELALDEINRLGATAMLTGQDIVVWPAEAEGAADEQEDAVNGVAGWLRPRHELGLPPDWRIELDRPLVVRANASAWAPS